MGRKKHPCKEIEKAVQHAEHLGGRYQKTGNSSHAWGRLLCPLEGCSMSIWSTPRDGNVHAQQIYRNVKACPHQ